MPVVKAVSTGMMAMRFLSLIGLWGWIAGHKSNVWQGLSGFSSVVTSSGDRKPTIYAMKYTNCESVIAD
jgi:hypothetical protein